MLTENQINLLPERIYQRLNDINTEYLESIGRTLKEIGRLRPTDVHKLQQMYSYGEDIDRITQKLADASGKNIQEIYELFDIVAKDNYNYSNPFYDAQGLKFIPYEQNENLQRYVKSIAKQTVDEYVNLTQHTAFAVFAKDGKSIAPLFAKNKDKIATSLSDTYTKIVDYAVAKVQLGETDYQSAMREVIRAMTKSGIKTVDYATGYSRRLDTTVRQNILWGAKQCNQNSADLIGEEFGADGYEISYHSYPRPTHADMGGKQYAIGKARTVNGIYYPSFSTVAHLLEEYNCYHYKFPILLGISRPAYTDDELAELKANDKKTFEFEGNTYTGYEGTQLQRKIETEIRKQKDIANMAKAAGDDDLRREAQYKINMLKNKYVELSKASGLPTKMERASVAGFRPVKTVDKLAKSGIMKATNNTEVNDVHSIGKIDKSIYQKVTENKIITDDVIITSDRIQHIIDRRGQKFYDEYNQYFAEIVSNPDYIFKDKAENTAIAVKTFSNCDTAVNLVVRLMVEGENKNYKNSIITAIRENKKRFNQRLRNNEPIYSRFDKNE